MTLPATIMTSSVPTTVGGHMMYPSPHAVMYAPTSGLADGGLAVLNAFPQAPSAMQVSHGQVQDQGKAPVQVRAPRECTDALVFLVPRVFMLSVNRRRVFFAAVLVAARRPGKGDARCMFLGLLCKGLHEMLMSKKGEGFWDEWHVGQAAEGSRRLWRGDMCLREGAK